MIAPFFGRLGKGKSTLAYHWAVRLNRGVLVFDANAQFTKWPTVSGPVALDDAIARAESPIIYRPRGNVHEQFAIFAAAVWNLYRVTVIVDESSLLQDPHSINPSLEDLIRLGREREFSILTTQHRPQDAHGIVMSLATDYFFFRTTRRLDLDRIANETNEEVAERVKQLGPANRGSGQEYLHWNVEAETFYVNSDSDSWFLPIKSERKEALCTSNATT
jgi:hypothetical protein